MATTYHYPKEDKRQEDAERPSDAPGYKVYAPFTVQQVAALNARQVNEMMHPYTCGGCKPARILHPTQDGLKCALCGWHQTWAHKIDTL